MQRLDIRDIFTRDVCEVTIEGGIATVSVQTGNRRYNIEMRFETLVANMAACETAIAAWQRKNGAEPIPLYAGCRDCSRHPHATRA